MKETLKQMGIEDSGSMSPNGSYIIDYTSDPEGLTASDKLDKARSKIDNSKLFDFDDDASLLTDESSIQQFYNEDYTITLKEDLTGETDLCQLIMREN